MIKSILAAAALVVGLAATPSFADTKPAPKMVPHHHHHPMVKKVEKKV